MTHPCKLYDSNLPSRDRKPFKKKEESALTSKVIARHKMLRQLAASVGDVLQAKTADIAQRSAVVEALFVQNVGNIVSLNPKQRDHIHELLARAFDVKTKLLGLSPNVNNLSLPGEVRQNLLQAARVADGLLDTQGRAYTMKLINELDSYLGQVLKDYGVKGANRQELMYNLLESGLTAKHQALYGNTVNVTAELTKTVNSTYKLLTDLGISKVDIDALIYKANEVGVSFETTRIMVNALGVRVPELYNIGWLPREFTPDFQLRIQDADEHAASILSEIREARFRLGTAHTKSRATWKYIPEDTAFLSELSGLTPQQLTTLMQDGTVLRNYLIDNFSEGQLDLLVDSGVLSKLPMTTPEVFDYFVRSYELPYKEMNEMFILDPKRAFDGYVGQLSYTLRNSAMLRLLGKEGLEKGWTATRAMVDANPQLAGFVKLGNVKHPVIQEALREAGSDGLYVHPMVVGQLTGLADLATSPAHLGKAAATWQEFTSMLRGMYIGSSNVAYLGHQFFANMVSLHAMGADFSNMVPSMYDVVKAHRLGMDAFDNVKPYRVMGGETLTKRQFMETVFTQRGVPFTPLVPGERMVRPDLRRLDPKRLQRLMNYAYTYAQNTKYGSPFEAGWRGATYVGHVLKEGLDKWYSIWAGLGSYIDLSARITAYKTMSQLPPGHQFWAERIMQVATGMSIQRFDDFDKLGRYVDDYLPMFDEIGSVTAVGARFVRPFLAWQMMNLPMQIRHMMRHPTKYYNWVRLMQVIGDEGLGDDRPAEGEFQAYDLDEYPITMYRDPHEKQTVILTPTNYDPVLGTLTYLRGMSENISMALGGYPHNTQKQRERIKQELGKDPPGWIQGLYKLAGETYAGPLIEALTGIDPYTGRQVKENPWVDNTYLGMKMPVWAEAVLSLVPYIDAIDRTNPGGALGVQPIRDARTGGVIRPERLSIFGQKRDKGDPTIDDAADRNWAMKMMRALGFRVRTVNGLVNMGYAYQDTVSLTTNLKSEIRRQQINLAAERKTLSEGEFKSRTEKINHMIEVWLQLEWDLGRIKTWMHENGVPDKEVFQKIKEAGVAVEGLPLPGSDFLSGKLMEAQRMREEMEKTRKVRPPGVR